jgi:transcriptional regulator with XRE-family HTH domain
MDVAMTDTIDLRAILARYGLVEKDLERVLRVTPAAIGYWRRGERKPSPQMVIRAEEKLNIPRYELRPDLWPPPEGHRKRRQKTPSRRK